MRILFVENRQKTYLWEQVAERLQADGHSITWVVQNHGYKPRLKTGKIIPIPYPTFLQQSQQSLAAFRFIRSSDRNINYFQGNDHHYHYYNATVQRILHDEAPEVVFGEATLFHELLFIQNCRQRSIPYLNPSTCRYPTGRFSFYLFDTLEPFQGSGKTLPNTEAANIIEHIANRTVQPDYMRQTKRPSQAHRLSEQLKLTYQYLRGERFNTPSPFVKHRLEKRLNREKLEWEATALHEVPSTKSFKVLYAIQMQPEANLDVWGNPYRDQGKVLENVVANTDEQTDILVKPNPKSKYELFNLKRAVQANSRLLPLSHSLPMAPVFSRTDLVIAITGTVALECILSGKPVVSLVRTLNNQAPGCIYLDDLAKLPAIISQVREGAFPVMSMPERMEFLQLMHKTSYKGRISDPLNDTSSIDTDNIDHLHSAFSHVLAALRSGERVRASLTP